MAQEETPVIAKMKQITAQDIMSLNAITINDEAMLFMAAHLIMRFKISGMPVVDKDDKVVGIITVTDLFRLMGDTVSPAAEQDKKKSIETNIVKNVMSRNVVTVRKNTSFYELLTIMCDKNIHTLPVLDGDKLIGIVGRRDVINTYYKLVNEMWH
ncbi:MAG: CBS domain-containing protein [Candidatus Omnitrophica bacterium]|nr:CBS domain-containing protein [Candidatus Omnitrophota bacterium]